MSVTVKVLNAKKEVTRKAKVTKKNILVIEAKTNENYQLIDDQTGYAPQNIIAKRQGKDLVINLNDGDDNPDIIIKNYYDENGETTNLVVGLHENGKIYAYIPESGNTLEAISVLAEEIAAPQALGGEEIVGGLWVFNPWWLAAGAGVLGGVALAAGGGGSGGSGSGQSTSELSKAKEDAKKELEQAAEAKKAEIDASNATQEEKDKAKAEVDKALEKAKTDVDNATDKEGVNSSKDNNAGIINTVNPGKVDNPPEADDLPKAKEGAKKELDEAAQAKKDAIDAGEGSTEDKNAA
ncbi:DUF1542 domain-containing protein, partial [Haemophilus haemoglobinophilus]|nr:DUF1542 domain-containing protein [Canicola haemoglobinophilus]